MSRIYNNTRIVYVYVYRHFSSSSIVICCVDASLTRENTSNPLCKRVYAFGVSVLGAMRGDKKIARPISMTAHYRRSKLHDKQPSWSEERRPISRVSDRRRCTVKKPDVSADLAAAMYIIGSALFYPRTCRYRAQSAYNGTHGSANVQYVAR